ncbi:MAG: phosphatase PAP2 family protein [Candidatus Thorarchaeota archaeon]|jgi:membrane-associated phospholipid phosphatase
MLFDPGLTDVLRNLFPGLGGFFFLITQLGGTLFIVVALLIAYWAYNKRGAIFLTCILIVSIISEYYLKVIIANERPPASNWYPGVDPPNYSTPSGHAQNSSTLYGWLTTRVKTWWIALLSIILVGLIGISRIYLGVHYLGDVLLGWGIGIAIVLVFVYLEKPAKDYLSKYNSEHLLVVLLIAGFLLTLIASLLPQPPNDNLGAYGGLTMGFAIGLILEMRFVNFTTEPYEGHMWRLILRVLIGLLLVIGVMYGLEPILASEVIWLRAVRYSLVAITGIFVWPAIFKKANL